MYVFPYAYGSPCSGRLRAFSPKGAFRLKIALRIYGGKVIGRVEHVLKYDRPTLFLGFEEFLETSSEGIFMGSLFHVPVPRFGGGRGV